MLFSKIKSLFGKKITGQKIYEDTLHFKEMAFYFVMPIIMKYGDTKPIQWIIDEPKYAANYMLGFTSEFTKGYGEKLWASYSYMAAWHIFKTLTQDDKTGLGDEEKWKVLKPFLEYVQSNQINDDMSAFEDGAADGEGFLEKKNLPKALNKHFGNPSSTA